MAKLLVQPDLRNQVSIRTDGEGSACTGAGKQLRIADVTNGEIDLFIRAYLRQRISGRKYHRLI